jgi:protocatechuate 3,4-dioxygenase beta subunit
MPLGPVGKLLKRLNRHPYRPSHMHFMIIADGYDTLVTALYVKGDPFETSDAVFGVKSSLIVDVKTVEDEAMAKQYGVTKGDWLIDWDFVCSNGREWTDFRLWSGKSLLISFVRNLLRRLWLESPCRLYE